MKTPLIVKEALSAKTYFSAWRKNNRLKGLFRDIAKITDKSQDYKRAMKARMRSDKALAWALAKKKKHI